MIGKRLRTAPNTVQRHFETLRDASARATRISEADGILVFGAMRDVRIETRDFLAPLFIYCRNAFYTQHALVLVT